VTAGKGEQPFDALAVGEFHAMARVSETWRQAGVGALTWTGWPPGRRARKASAASVEDSSAGEAPELARWRSR
jgi:hypothetical protein